MPPVDSVDLIISNAMQAFQRGDDATARSGCEQVLGIDPSRADVWNFFGVLHRRAGKIPEAIAAYRRAIEINQNYADSYYNLANLLKSTHQYEACIALYRRALALVPDRADAWSSLADSLRELEQWPEAEAASRRAISLQPTFVGAHLNLGNALRGQGRIEEATASYRQAISLDPKMAEAYYNLGMLLREQGSLEAAAEAYQQVLNLRPDWAEASVTLGILREEIARRKVIVPLLPQEKVVDPVKMGEKEDSQALLASAMTAYQLGENSLAMTRCEQVLKMEPNRPDAWTLKGILLRKLKQFEESAAAHRRAIACKPDYPDAHNNLGGALSDLGKLEEALACYRHAVHLVPKKVDFLINLAGMLQALGRVEQAITTLEQVISAHPGNAEAQWDLALARLLSGDFERGWKGYEWRWKARIDPPVFAEPLWRGEPLDGKTILLYTEQGYGDVIQFVRYIPMVVARGGRVLLEIHPDLKNLLDRMPGISQLVIRDEPRPHFDVQYPLLSLPYLFQTTLDTLPSSEFYLQPDPMRKKAWGERLKNYFGLRVGLVWGGNPNVKNDRWRSPRLAPVLPLLETSGVHFFGLQKGDGRKDLIGRDMPTSFVDLGEEIQDFADTAAILSNLDLLITSCTSTVHLAGALGRPTWVLLHFSADWRWFLKREDTPWYPSVRLFRQSGPHQWGALVNRIQTELSALVAGDRTRLLPTPNTDEPSTSLTSHKSSTRRVATPPPPILATKVRGGRAGAAAKASNLLAMAMEKYNKGSLSESQKLCEQTLKLAPERADAWTLMGALHRRAGRLEQAVLAYRRAIRLQPDYADAHGNLGNVLRAQEKWEEAIAAYQRAIAIRPRSSGLLGSLSDTLHTAKRFPEAEEAARRAIEADPNATGAYLNLGNALKAQRQWEQAAESYRKALALDPQYVEAYCNLGQLLRGQGNLSESEESFRQAIAIRPGYIEAHAGLASTLETQGKLVEARKSCQYVVDLDPNRTASYVNLGNVIQTIGYLQESADVYRQALQRDKECVEAHLGLGAAYFRLGKLEEAKESLREAIRLNSDFPQAYNNLGNVLKLQGKSEEAVSSYREALRLSPESSDIHSNILLAINYASGYSLEQLYAEHRRFEEVHGEPLKALIRPHRNSKNPNRRIKVGYVSADLRRHAVAYFIEPVFKNHDHERFSIYGYHNSPQTDEVTERLKGYSDGWVDCVGMTDEILAEQIRSDEIDILVDLSGHSAKNRLLAFARKPAPVQATWIGYPNTTGLSTIDYCIVDQYNAPYGILDNFYSEKLIRLPESGSVYAPSAKSPEPVSKAPVLERGYVTFGSFNNFAKVTVKVIDVWSQVLRAVPNAKLFIEAPGLEDPMFQNQIRGLFKTHQISEDRLELIARLSTNHYKFYNHVDVCLDPFPFNGGTTSCDTTWMGVPFVTLAGDSLVSRIGVSVLSNVGLPELVANTPEEYVSIAVRLATDRDFLLEMRRRLQREHILKSALFDAKRFTGQLEVAYRQMWQDWCVRREIL
ncbi:protein O-GlcNAc transferase [Gammaproteobacteria bacterium]